MVNFIAGTILILVSLVGLIFGCRVWNLHDDSWHKSELLKLLVGALFMIIIGIILITKEL